MPERSYRDTAVEAFTAAKWTTDEWRKLAEDWDFQSVLCDVYKAGRNAAAGSIREEAAERVVVDSPMDGWSGPVAFDAEDCEEIAAEFAVMAEVLRSRPDIVARWEATNQPGANR